MNLKFAFVTLSILIGIGSVFQNCSGQWQAGDSASVSSVSDPVLDVVSLSKLAPADLAGLSDDEIIAKIIESLEITIQFLEATPGDSNRRIIRRLRGYIQRLTTDMAFRQAVLDEIKKALTPPPPPPVPPPAPGPAPDGIKCEKTYCDGTPCWPTAKCFTNAKINSFANLEKEAARLLDKPYANMVCRLYPDKLHFPPKDPAYPLEWTCAATNTPRMEWTQPTGFRTGHLNSPFRCAAESDPYGPSNPGGEGDVTPPPEKGARICLFEKEEFAASAVQDALDEAFENRIRYGDRNFPGPWEFQVNCAEVTLPVIAAKVLRCQYTQPICTGCYSP